MQYRTRFAPSPSGLLHVGNAYSALFCARWAKQNEAELLLRIEDIDHTRCKPEYAKQMIADLAWLGLSWPQPLRYQSQCLPAYQQALLKLQDMDVIYPCFCTRNDIQLEIKRLANAPHTEDSAAIYPGLCRGLSIDEQQQRMQHESFAWRLDIDKAMNRAMNRDLDKLGRDLYWQEAGGEQHALHINHDIVIGRKDIRFSYHLAVVVDDAAQHISHIIRGEDLKDSTDIHRLLQALLQLPVPVYVHHPLVYENTTTKLSKRIGGSTLQSLRQMGVDAQKLCAFLNHARPLHWPFGQSMPDEILQILGNGY